MYQTRVVGVLLNYTVVTHGIGGIRQLRTQRYPIGLGLSAGCMSPIRVCAAEVWRAGKRPP